MSPPPESTDNPVVGLLRCECGKVMKVRRRTVGHRGRCKRCDRVLHAKRSRLEPLPPAWEEVLDEAATGAVPEAPWPVDDSTEVAAPVDADAGGRSDPGVDAADSTPPGDEDYPLSQEVISGSRGIWAAQEPPVDSADAAWTATDGVSEDWAASTTADDEIPSDPFANGAPGGEGGEDAPASPEPVVPPFDDIPTFEIRGGSDPGMDQSAAAAAAEDEDWDASDGATFEVPLGVSAPGSSPLPPSGPVVEREAPEPDASPGAGEDEAADAEEALALDEAGVTPRDTSWDGVAPPSAPEDPPAHAAPAEEPPPPDEPPSHTWDASDSGTFEVPLEATTSGGTGEPSGPETAPDAAAEQEGEISSWDGVAPQEPERAAASPRGKGSSEWDGIAPADAAASPGPPAPPPPASGEPSWDSVARGVRPTPPAGVPGAPQPSGQLTDPFADSMSAWLDAEEEDGREATPVEASGTPRPRAGADRESPSRPHGSAPGERAGPGHVGRQRPALFILPFCVLSLGVYYFVWVYSLFAELRDHILRSRSLSPGLAVGLHFVVPGWGFYVLYRLCTEVNELQELEGRPPVTAPGLAVGTTVSGTLLSLGGAGMAGQTPLGWALAGGGVLLWWWALAHVQAGVNDHWIAHEA